MKIALVTDSTSSLTQAEVRDNQITVVPMPIYIGDQSYLEGVNITADELFDLQRNGSDFPKTSQPGIGACLQLFDRLHREGYEAIIYISLTSGISGTINTLNSIAKEHPEYNLYPYDSTITIRLQGYLVLAAARMISAGLKPKQILKRLDQIRDSIDELFIVDDLNNLSRGGRLSNAGAFVGTLLNIKPLLTFEKESNKIVAFDKVRSMKRAVTKVEKIAQKRIDNSADKDKFRFIIVHSNDLEQAQEIEQFVHEKYPAAPTEISEFSPVIAVHLGEKSLGLTWMLDIDQLDLNN